MMDFSQVEGVVRLIDRAHLRLCGPDRTTFLQSFCTQDVESLTTGTGAEAFACNDKARVLGHFFVFATEDALILTGSGPNRETLPTHFGKYLLLSDAELRDDSDLVEEALFIGERPRRFVMDRFNISLSDHLSHAIVEERDTRWHVRRIDGFGSELTSVVGSKPATEELIRASEFPPSTRESWDAIRIAAAFPEFGTDIGEQHLAPEADRNAQAICYTKGCYLGQEPIARIDALGRVNRRLTALRWKGQKVSPDTPVIRKGTDEVGQLTSTAPVPNSHEHVGLGILRCEAIEDGADLTVAGMLASPVAI